MSRFLHLLNWLPGAGLSFPRCAFSRGGEMFENGQIDGA
jgi:hypothetical protein